MSGRPVTRESVLTYTTPRVSDDVVAWKGTLTGRKSFTVAMEFSSPDARRFRPAARPWLLAFLPAAMRLGNPLVVDGPVDQGTIDNLMEWQEAQVVWHPRKFSVVPIRADIERRPRRPKPGGAITAFSGGVDSSFTLFRHATAGVSSPFRSTDLRAGLMVHGFDIKKGNETEFRTAYARSERMLRAYGVTPYWLRTDLRKVGRALHYSWAAKSHGISLAAVLACYEQFFSHSIIPSSYPYDHPILPWGSTPMTDHLLGSASRPVWHDGASHDKLAKVSAFAHEAPIAADLRVCFRGKHQDRNCGACFKCLTTQACFWINGVDRPACFETTAAVRDLAGLELTDSYKILLADRMRSAAETAGRPDVVAALSTALDKSTGALV